MQQMRALISQTAYIVLALSALPSMLVAAPATSLPPGQAEHRGNRILTFGGGPSPQSSQASLEQNVLYLRRVLAALELGDVRQDVYFTDGSASGRTVQVRGAATPEMQLRRTVASIFGDDGDDVQLRFRTPQIPDIAGPSTPAAIGKWFDTTGK